MTQRRSTWRGRNVLALALALALSACATKKPAVRPAPPAPSMPEAAAGVRGPVQAWLTNGDATQLLARLPDIPAATAADRPGFARSFANRGEVRGTAPDAIAIAIDTAQRRQVVTGFGAALTDAASALLVHGLDDARRQALLDELFGGGADALGLNLARLAVGSSEFARSRYGIGDTDDPNLATVSIEPDRDAVLPAVKAALEVNPDLRLIATPYSAPAWLKTSGSLVGGTLRPDGMDTYARYLKRWIDVYREEGVPIHALTVQNEPNAAPADAPGMQLDADARAALIGRLGPLLDGVRLLDLDDNWAAGDAALKVLARPDVARHVDGTAWHCYAGEPSAQSAVHDAHPGKRIYVTECSGGTWAPGWRDNLTHFGATAIVGGMRHWANGVMLGNLALDARGGPHIGGCGNCRGVVTIEGGEVVRNPEYYALAHASRFVRPGAVNVGSSGAVDGVSNAAFVNPDGRIVVIVVNAAAGARSIDVQGGGVRFSASLPGGSMATYVW